MEIEEIISAFNQSILPKVLWTHEAHLKVGIWHIHNYAFEDAVYRMKAKIISLNNFHETPNTSSSGYHKTMTIFWLKIIEKHHKSNSDKPLNWKINDFLKSEFADLNLPFVYYLRE